MGVFESMILMRVTTVTSVTEQIIFSEKQNQRKQLLQTVFDRYNSYTPQHTLTIPVLQVITTNTCETH